MHYTEKAKLEIQELKDKLKNAEDRVIETMVYLNSPKFYQDTTVQKSDMIDRLFNVIDAIRNVQ